MGSDASNIGYLNSRMLRALAGLPRALGAQKGELKPKAAGVPWGIPKGICTCVASALYPEQRASSARTLVGHMWATLAEILNR